MGLASLFVWFFLLGAIIVAAGMFLTKYADALASITGIGRTLAGLVLLAAATSLPELAVDCSLVLLEPPAPDQAVGALVGSSLFNLLILGVLEFCHRQPKKIFSIACEEQTISTVTSLVTTAILALSILLAAGDINLKVFNVGLGPILIAVIYIASLRLIYLDQKARRGIFDEEVPASITLREALLGYVVTTAIIFVAASYLAPTSEAIAKQTGLGDTFVGSTFVALTTSLPELVTTAAAVRMSAFNMALGNVVGSNNFNMAILLPVDCIYRSEALLADVSMTHVAMGLIVMLITSVVIMSLVYRGEKKFWLIEPDASLIVLLAISGIVVLYTLRHWAPTVVP